jgi:hypothetical protein
MPKYLKDRLEKSKLDTKLKAGIFIGREICTMTHTQIQTEHA